MKLRGLSVTLLVLLLACEPSGRNAAPPATVPSTVATGVPSPSASAPTTVGAHPDAASILAVGRRLDVQCKDTCCVPKIDWIGEGGAPLEAEDLQVARGVAVTATDPLSSAIALRIVSHSPALSDVPLLTRFVDDTRASGVLPREQVGQMVRECDPISWSEISPSKEALHALGRLFGTPFASPAAYHAWAVANPDPERVFEVWNARFAQGEPPPPALVGALRAKDALLFVRVMAFRCHGENTCGVSPAELAQAIQETLGAKRALAWLDGSEKVTSDGADVGHTYANLLRSGERVFSRADVSALAQLWNAPTFARTIYQGMLAVLLSRLDSGNAKTYWRQALAQDAGVPEAGAALVLQESARRDPVGMEPDLRAWLTARSKDTGDGEGATAIWAGLAEAQRSAGRVFGRLTSVPYHAGSDRWHASLWDAATHFGCAGLGPRDSLERRMRKHQSASDAEREKLRSLDAQRTFLSAARACGTRLAK